MPHSWARRQGWPPPRDLGPSRERPPQEPWRVREPSRAMELWGSSRGPERSMARVVRVVRVVRKLEVQSWPPVVEWGPRGSTLVRMLDPLHTFVQGPQSWEENAWDKATWCQVFKFFKLIPCPDSRISHELVDMIAPPCIMGCCFTTFFSTRDHLTTLPFFLWKTSIMRTGYSTNLQNESAAPEQTHQH